MKRKAFLAIALVLVLLLSAVPAAALSESQYTVDDGVCTISGTVASFTELEDLAKRDDVDSIIFFNADIQTNNLWELQELGNNNNGLGTSTVDSPIPSITILSQQQASIRAFKELPLYSVTDGTFAQTHNTKTIDGIQYPQDFKWQASVRYIYDKTRDNSVAIKHQVTDKSGLAMLQYRDAEGDEFPGDYNIDTANDAIEFLKINAPQTETDQSYLGRVLYSNVIWGYTMLSETEVGSPFAGSVSYRYEVVPEFYSAVGLELDVEYIGAVEIVKENEAGEALAGASFKLYTDQACETEAVKYDGTPVGEVTTGSDGKVVIDGLKNGVYYARETKAPKGYLLNDEVKMLLVAGQYTTDTLTLTGGEGTDLTINKEKSTFIPKWDGNAKNTGKNPLETTTEDTESKTAASYGKDVFIKGGGSAVSFSDASLAQKIQNNAVESPTYTLTVGNITKTYTDLNALLAYINNDLIGGKVIDSADARDLVDITCNVDKVYIPYTTTAASVTFIDEYIPVTVTVNKSWVNDTPAQRGEFLLVQLLCDGEPVAEEDGGIVELNEANNWSYTWENLPGNHNYSVAEPDVPENYVMSSKTSEDDTDTMIYITVDITNEYVSGAAETFDNSLILLAVSGMMILMVCYLALKIRKTPTR